MIQFKYFKDCHTAEEGKALYRKLVMQHHPDNGGDSATMGQINDEFRAWWKVYKDRHQTQEGKTYTSEQKTTETADEFIDILSKLSRHKDLIIDFCGSWLWIKGNTYPYREDLKSYGCQWSKGHKCWFYAHGLDRKKGKGRLSDKEITEKYGRERVQYTYNPILGIQ